MNFGRGLLLGHWNADEAAALRQEGWADHTEAEDGARACRRIADEPPWAMVIFLDRLPSHGRWTGHALRQRSSSQDLPIPFVNGAPAKVPKVRQRVPHAEDATADELPAKLSLLDVEES